MKTSRSVQVRMAGWLAACSLVSAGLVAVPPVGAAEARDRVVAGGYDFIVTRSARVIAGAPDTNLVFRYVASSRLHDGTVTLEVPRSSWPDRLWPNLDVIRGRPADRGSVVVRPIPADSFPPDPGQPAGADCLTASTTWKVTRTPAVQRITVQHLSCEPGQQAFVRIWGIRAPRRLGIHRFPMTVTDSTGPRRVQSPRVRVFPQPRTRLEVSLPSRVPWGETPVTVVVKALRRDGRVDRSYRGGVTLTIDGLYDCSVDWRLEPARVHDFTAADAGVYRFSVILFRAGRVVARDVGREARSGASRPFVFTDEPDVDGVLCPWPISFH